MKNSKPKGLVPGGKYALGLSGSRANNELIMTQERDRIARENQLRSLNLISNLANRQDNGVGGIGGVGPISGMAQSGGGGIGAMPKTGGGAGSGGIGGEGGIPGSMARQIFEQNTNPAPFRNFSSGSLIGTMHQEARDAMSRDHNSEIDAAKVLDGKDVMPGSPMAPQQSQGSTASDAAGMPSGGIASPPKLNWADSQKTPLYQEENAFPPPGGIGAFRRGGTIPGHDLKGKDNVPVKVTRGEAILPVKTVDAMGGPNAISQLIQRTNGKPPADAVRKDGKFSDGVAPEYDLDETAHANNTQVASKPPSAQPAPTLAQMISDQESGMYGVDPEDDLDPQGRIPGLGIISALHGAKSMSPLATPGTAPTAQQMLATAQANNTQVASKPPSAQPAPTLAQMISDQESGMDGASAATPAIAQLAPTPAQTDKQNFLGGFGIGAPGSAFKRLTGGEFDKNGETYGKADTPGGKINNFVGIGTNPVPWEQRPENAGNYKDAISRIAKMKVDTDTWERKNSAHIAGLLYGPQAEDARNTTMSNIGIAQQTADMHKAQQQSLGTYQGAQTAHANAQAGQILQQSDENSNLSKQLANETDPGKIHNLMMQYAISNKHPLPERYKTIALKQYDPNGMPMSEVPYTFDPYEKPNKGVTSAQTPLPPGLVVGAPTKQPDGTYPVNGKTVIIKSGKVTEIK